MGTVQNFSAARCDHRLFTAVLSSAYSLQQQHDRIRSQVRAARFNEIIAEVVSTHSLIRKRNLDLDTTLQLVVNRTQKLAEAAGAAVALLNGEELEYRVGTGLGATLLGLKVMASASLSFARLKSEPCVETDTWQDNALSRRLVAKVLTAPIYSRGELAGCIQLFCRNGRFECDGVHACELMASIVGQRMTLSDWRRGFEPNPTTARGDEWQPTALPTEVGFIAQEHSDSELREDNESTVRRTFARELKKPAASTWARAEGPGAAEVFRRKLVPSSFVQKAATCSDADHQCTDFEHTFLLDDSDISGRNFPRVSVPVSVVANRLGPLHDVTGAGSVLATPSNAMEANFPINHSSEEWEDYSLKPEVRRRKAWHSLSLIAYPAFVLIFAIIVRVNAGVHSWSLEIVLYVLVVVTTLEMRRRVLKE